MEEPGSQRGQGLGVGDPCEPSGQPGGTGATRSAPILWQPSRRARGVLGRVVGGLSDPVQLGRQPGVRSKRRQQEADQARLSHVESAPHAVRVVPAPREPATVGVLPGRPSPGIWREPNTPHLPVTRIQAPQRAPLGRGQHCKGSADRAELARRRQHLRPYLIQLALAQQPGRRAIP